MESFINFQTNTYIHKDAHIEEGVKISPGVYIGPGVKIKKGTILKPYTYIECNTIIGENNEIGPFTVIGTAPQHIGYKGEETFVEIGNNNIIREFVTIHRGTKFDDGITRIGNNCLLMSYVHIAHDCKLGDRVIMANNATLGGHVRVGNYVVMGGFSAIHQFCKIGDYAFISAMTGVNKDVPPYVKVFGIPAKIQGINIVGLKRAGFSKEEIRKISQAISFFMNAPGTLKEIIQELKEIFKGEEKVEVIINFLENPSKQGLLRKKPGEGEEPF